MIEREWPVAPAAPDDQPIQSIPFFKRESEEFFEVPPRIADKF